MKKSINQSTLNLILNGISIVALIFMGFALFSNSQPFYERLRVSDQ